MTNKKILIVEDEPFLLELYKTRFEQENFIVNIAMNGTTVIAECDRDKPDLVLLDIIMPEQDGYQVLKDLKKSPKYKFMPILVFSNLAQEEEIQKGLLLGADDYFVKSNYTPSQIVEKVNKMIEQSVTKKKPTKKKTAKKK